MYVSVKICLKNLPLWSYARESKRDEEKLEILKNKLNNDFGLTKKEKKEKDETRTSAKKLFFIREEIMRAFKKGIFPYIDGFRAEKKSDEESDKDTLEAVETTDMPDLESEESADQSGQGLKILTPNQVLSRLPITLAQLKAGNNSQKLKNEIRQLLYSLYRSKKLTKTIYNNLINII